MNPHRGDVEIELGGKKRVFRASLKSLAEAESASGERIVDWINKGLTLNGARFLLVSSCSEAISLDEVDQWMDEEGFGSINGATSELFYMGLYGQKERDRIFEEMESQSKKNDKPGTGSN